MSVEGIAEINQELNPALSHGLVPWTVQDDDGQPANSVPVFSLSFVSIGYGVGFPNPMTLASAGRDKQLWIKPNQESKEIFPPCFF